MCSPPQLIDNTGNTDQSLAVTTTAAFQVDTNTGNALTITGRGAVSFTDSFAASYLDSSGFANSTALSITSVGDTTGTPPPPVTPGSVTVETSGTVTGDKYGIDADNDGSGALSITVNGVVAASRARTDFLDPSFGIRTENSGTNLTVITNAGTTVSGNFGVVARNFGTGTTQVTVSGDVTADNSNGIGFQQTYGRNAIDAFSLGTDIRVTTGAGTEVTGYSRGIYTRNFGSGVTEVKVSGNVKATAQGSAGIDARSPDYGTPYYGKGMTVTTAAGTEVTAPMASERSMTAALRL